MKITLTLEPSEIETAICEFLNKKYPNSRIGKIKFSIGRGHCYGTAGLGGQPLVSPDMLEFATVEILEETESERIEREKKFALGTIANPGYQGFRFDPSWPRV